MTHEAKRLLHNTIKASTPHQGVQIIGERVMIPINRTRITLGPWMTDEEKREVTEAVSDPVGAIANLTRKIIKKRQNEGVKLNADITAVLHPASEKISRVDVTFSNRWFWHDWFKRERVQIR